MEEKLKLIELAKKLWFAEDVIKAMENDECMKEEDTKEEKATAMEWEVKFDDEEDKIEEEVKPEWKVLPWKIQEMLKRGWGWIIVITKS